MLQGKLVVKTQKRYGLPHVAWSMATAGMVYFVVDRKSFTETIFANIEPNAAINAAPTC